MLPCRTTLFLAAGLLLCAPAYAEGQPSDPADLIARGFDALKASGADKAIEAWLKGSPIEGDATARSQSAMLNQIAAIYGPYDSFEVARTDSLGSRSKVIYVAAHFAKGDVFGKFLVFKTSSGWVLTIFLFHTNPDVVWPSSLAK